jgi:hypothetical protein
MQKISTFIRTFVRSVTSLSYYADVLRASFSFSFLYFVVFNVIAALVTAIKIAVPVSMFDLPQAANQLIAIYPQDLVVNINKGHLSINKPLPYAIPVPPQWQSQDKSVDEVQNLVVFDSDEQVKSVSDFQKYKTFALVTETAVYSEGNSDGQIKVSPISQEVNGAHFSRTEINQLRDSFFNHRVIKNKLYAPLIGLAVFIMCIPLFIGWHFWTVVMYSILVYIIVIVAKKTILHDREVSFGKIVQVGLHTITPLIVIGYIADALHFGSLWHGLAYLIAYLAMTLSALYAATLPSTAKPVPVAMKKADSAKKTKTVKSARKKK